jgi:hypothetical protein
MKCRVQKKAILLLILAFGLMSCSPGTTSIDKLPGVSPVPEPSSTPTSSGSPGPLRLGQWGGAHISLNVLDSGATLQLDCAEATMDQPMRADPDGYFRLTGKYTPGGGADPAGGRPSLPASFYGAADGSSMQLTVTYQDAEGQSHSTLYTLVYGESGALNRCL